MFEIQQPRHQPDRQRRGAAVHRIGWQVSLKTSSAGGAITRGRSGTSYSDTFVTTKPMFANSNDAVRNT